MPSSRQSAQNRLWHMGQVSRQAEQWSKPQLAHWQMQPEQYEPPQASQETEQLLQSVESQAWQE